MVITFPGMTPGDGESAGDGSILLACVSIGSYSATFVFSTPNKANSAPIAPGPCTAAPIKRCVTLTALQQSDERLAPSESGC
jgi:hypothetical protein